MIRDEFKVHTLAAGRRRRRARTGRGDRVDVMRVHPDVWRTALAIADGDLRRLDVISPTDVRVTNHAARDGRSGAQAPRYTTTERKEAPA